MKNIEIVTAQKVEISYPLASVVQRVVAFVLDAVVMVFGSWLLFTFITWIIPNSYMLQENLSMLLVSPFIVFYTLVSEVLMHGQTIGKKALNIRVIKTSGQRLEFADYVIRWIFRPIDIWFSTGAVAIILCISSESRQRIGDVLANTVVVKTQSTRNYELADVLNIMKLKDYSVTYKDAKQFSEPQMLILKETLERYKRHPNEAHRTAMMKLCKKISDQLQISKLHVKPELFLKTVLRDYIFMTR